VTKAATCLWFKSEAEEATRFYVETIPGSSLDRIVPYPMDIPHGKTGETMMTQFRLGGRDFMALNGNPSFPFTPAVSVALEFDGQAEVDRVWDALLVGGEAMACGWLKDRYGLAWQIVPKAMIRMLLDEDRTKVRRVFEAMTQMVKLDEAALVRAFEGR
jgi:predicted 3-demethylubiquinone-9 3-methyltransferase (glyoxalase superfamily)